MALSSTTSAPNGPEQVRPWTVHWKLQRLRGRFSWKSASLCDIVSPGQTASYIFLVLPGLVRPFMQDGRAIKGKPNQVSFDALYLTGLVRISFVV